MSAPTARNERVGIRGASAEDLPAITALDAKTTGIPKPGYWKDLFARFGARGDGRAVLLAEVDGEPVGFIIGEIRAWEFGSPPCGWIFALSVDPGCRQGGVASGLFDAICAFFRENGMHKVRTMLRRDDHLVMAFFRAQGMMAGPFIQLEKDLDQ